MFTPIISVPLAIVMMLNLSTTTLFKDEGEAPIQMINERSLSDSEFIEWKSLQNGLDPKMMLAIAKCESGIRQYNKNGQVIVSSTKDYGLFQIWHGNHAKAKELGFDVMTREGNMDFAVWLMIKGGGVRHWKASAKCHGYVAK